MDASVQWPVSADVGGLVARIEECRELLLQLARHKYNLARVGVEAVDAYAGDKVLQLLQCSDRWVPCCEMTEEDLRVPVWRREKKPSYLVADMGTFKLHRMSVLGETDVRVVAVVDVGDDSLQTLYGNVSLVGG